MTIKNLKEIIQSQLGYELAISSVAPKSKNSIELTLNPNLKTDSEEYKIVVNSNKILIFLI